MAEDVVYRIVFDKKTGAITEATSEMNKLGAAVKSTSQSGGDAVDKLGNKFTGLAAGLVIAQIAMAGLKKVAEESSAFQELQATFEKTARTALKELEPALALISRGLQGIVILIGGVVPLLKVGFDTVTGYISKSMDVWIDIFSAGWLAIHGDFKGAWEQMKTAAKDGVKAISSLGEGDWKTAWEKMKDSASNAFDRMSGKTKETTKAQVDALTERTTAEIAHIDAMAGIRQSASDAEFSALFQTEERKSAIIREQKAKQLADLDAKESLQLELLKAKKEQGLVTEGIYQEQITALRQSYGDRRAAINQSAAIKETQLEDQKTQKLTGLLQAQMTAFSSAAAKRYQETKDLGQALKAAAAAEIREMGNQAATAITIKGAEAAAKSFSNAGGYPFGIAAAAATFIFYAGLAAVVSGASGVAASGLEGASAPSGGGGGGGDTGGGGGTASSLGGGTKSSVFGGSNVLMTNNSAVRPIYNINVSGNDVLDSQKAARAIAEEIARLEKS